MKSILIIGGGLSGLASAVDLSSSGYSVTILEQHRHLGGRTYSFIDPLSGDAIDNGQHLMMGCYRYTFDYLIKIGAFHKLEIETDLHIQFRHPTRGIFKLECPRLPAPYHLFFGLLRLKSISLKDKLCVLRVLPDLVSKSRRNDKKLENLTVDAWLTRCGQSEQMKEYLWNLIAIATLNDSPKKLSAKIFVDVLRAAFLHKRSDSSIVHSSVGLSELFVDGAVQYLNNHNVKIHAGKEVDRIRINDGRMVGVECRTGEYYTADAVVCSVPYFSLEKILWNSGQVSETVALQSDLENFSSSPILSVHLWFDRKVMEERFVGLLDSDVHWVFNKSAFFGKPVITSQYVSLVISGAQEFIAESKETLITLAVEELEKVFPLVKSARLLQAKVIKERRATFSAYCGINNYRPYTRTEIPNFFLAGDWTATGLPATIEGAVKSGYDAAKAVRNSFKE